MDLKIPQMLKEVETILSFVKALSSEDDQNKILEMILSEARKITGADAGTLFIKEGDALFFKIIQNDTLFINRGGEGEEIQLPPVHLQKTNVSAYVALTKKIVNIPDVYQAERFDFSGPRRYDSLTGYRTTSMLVLPLENHRGEVIGVLQLINALNPKGQVIPFHANFERVITSLASQAAISLTNIQFVKGIEGLFRAFIKLMVTAYESCPLTQYRIRFSQLLEELVLVIEEGEGSIMEKYLQLKDIYSEMDGEMNRAKEIHEQNLISSFSQLEKISIAAHYQPAKKIGGDFYDIIKKDSKIVIYLSDITGHGLDGSMLSLFVKNTIKSYLSLMPLQEITPEGILMFLDKQFRLDDYPEDYFISLFLAVFDEGTGLLHFSGAGFQESPLLVKENGFRGVLMSQGLPISKAVPKDLMEFQSQKIPLHFGDTILFTTDGLTEQEVDQKMYSERCKALFYSHQHLTPKEVVHLIKDDFYHFNHKSPQGTDDITFLVLKVN